MFFNKSIFSNTLKTQRKNYQPEVDGLRAVAVILVLLFHLNPNGLFPGGFIGVDVFFVISGFLITGIIYDQNSANNFSYIEFLERRVSRLYPTLLFTIFLVLILGFLFYNPSYYTNVANTGEFALFSISNIFFSRTKGYWDLDSTLNPFLHTWSLGVEQQFYLIWPLIIILITKLNKRYVLYGILFTYALAIITVKLLKLVDINYVIESSLYAVVLIFIAIYYSSKKYILIISLIIISLLSLYLAQTLSKIQPTKNFYYMPTRIFELGAGGIWYIFYKQNEKVLQSIKNIYKEIIFIIGLFVIIYCAYIFQDDTHFHPGINTLPIIIASIFCIYGGTSKYTSIITKNRFSIFIGLISYSIYLIHWPLIVFYKHYAIKAKITAFEQLIIFVLTIVFAYLMYIGIENKHKKFRLFPINIQNVYFISCFILLFALINMIRSNNGILIHQSKENNNIIPKDFVMPDYINGYCFHYNPQDFSIMPQATTCKIGDKQAGLKGLLFGDSFAGHYDPFWDEIGKTSQLNITSIPAVGCQATIKDNYLQDNEMYKQCLYNRDYLFQNYSEYDFIIISSWWYFVNISNNVEDFFNFVDFFSKKMKLVIIMPSPKGFDVDVGEIFKSHTLNLSIIPRKFNIDSMPHTIDDHSISVHTQIQKRLKSYKNVIFIERDDLFSINGKYSDVTKDGIPNTVDRGHLSIYSSKLAAENYAKTASYLSLHKKLNSLKKETLENN